MKQVDLRHTILYVWITVTKKWTTITMMRLGDYETLGQLRFFGKYGRSIDLYI